MVFQTPLLRVRPKRRMRCDLGKIRLFGRTLRTGV
jgi:hypothetical protein